LWGIVLTKILSRIYAPAYFISVLGMVFAVAAYLAVLEYGKAIFVADFDQKATQRIAVVETEGVQNSVSLA
jgi:hypothetical protein